ncbi:amidase [Aquincola sp. MAHUQ-54]|uniref:Amidase n=1 Tax=Aquincola agrisoli TaxID=3119538 RepID=A0AAW9Q9F7_9BURK
MTGVLPGRHGAFVRDGHDRAPAAVRRSAALAGLRLAAKDVYDVEGLRTGAGNPAWRAAQAPAARSALAVERLLAASAAWVGRTVTDELTYSLAGINMHYGTPVNPASPGRLPGGSSSGSAVAVAAGDADIALGTDCGGSVRLPASYCGLWGMRPTHGRIATAGCFTLAHSFDTVGWFARNAGALAAVFAVLSGAAPSGGLLPAGEGEAASTVRWLHAGCIGPLLDASVRDAWETWLPALARHGGGARLAPPVARDLALADWAAAFRTLQAAEVWLQHGAWFERHGATLGDDVRGRFEKAARVTPAEVAEAQRRRVDASAVMARVLAEPGSVLVMPTVPTIAPSLDDDAARVDDVRQRSQQLLCLAGLAGLPQVSLPWLRIDGAPVGLSVIGARGDDEGVLSAAHRLHGWLSPTGGS